MTDVGQRFDALFHIHMDCVGMWIVSVFVRRQGLMRISIIVALALAVAGCSSTEPPPTIAIAGYYRLLTIDGQSLPTPAIGAPEDSMASSGLTIGADNGWTVKDTIGGLFQGTSQWGGIVVPDSKDLSRFIFQDSSRIGTRYTGTVSGDVFVLVNSQTFRYQRQH